MINGVWILEVCMVIPFSRHRLPLPVQFLSDRNIK